MSRALNETLKMAEQQIEEYSFSLHHNHIIIVSFSYLVETPKRLNNSVKYLQEYLVTNTTHTHMRAHMHAHIMHPFRQT